MEESNVASLPLDAESLLTLLGFVGGVENHNLTLPFFHSSSAPHQCPSIHTRSTPMPQHSHICFTSSIHSYYCPFLRSLWLMTLLTNELSINKNKNHPSFAINISSAWFPQRVFCREKCACTILSHNCIISDHGFRPLKDLKKEQVNFGVTDLLFCNHKIPGWKRNKCFPHWTEFILRNFRFSMAIFTLGNVKIECQVQTRSRLRVKFRAENSLLLDQELWIADILQEHKKP